MQFTSSFQFKIWALFRIHSYILCEWRYVPYINFKEYYYLVINSWIWWSFHLIFKDPHIGHIYTAVLADASARFQHMLGRSPIIFSTGTDEHGLKIQQASFNAKQPPLEFCNKISTSFRKALDSCEIGYTDYIRTTDKHHKDNVTSFWVTH